MRKIAKTEDRTRRKIIITKEEPNEMGWNIEKVTSFFSVEIAPLTHLCCKCNFATGPDVALRQTFINGGTDYLNEE